MKRLALSFLLTLGVGFLALFQQGCGTIHWVVVAAPTPTPSLPNASRIEARMGNQQNRVNNAVQTGNLDGSVADGLAQNIETVYQWETAYLQSKNDPYEDLTTAETRWLDRMLDDNSLAIDDAIRRNQAWMRLFRAENAYRYDFGSAADQRQFMAYLHFQIKAQRQRIDEYERAGKLSRNECQNLRQRVNAVGEMEKSYYRKNGKMGLSKIQFRQLRESLEKNSNDFKLLEERHGRPQPLPTLEPLFGPGKHFDRKDGRDFRRDNEKNDKPAPPQAPTATATHIPVFTPTAIPILQNHKEDEIGNPWNKRNKGRKDKKDISRTDEENRQDLSREVPAPTPEPSVKQVETPEVKSWKKTGRNEGSNRNQKNKKNRKSSFENPHYEKQDNSKSARLEESVVTPVSEPTVISTEEKKAPAGDDSEKTQGDGRNKKGKKDSEDSKDKEGKGDKTESVATPASDSSSNPSGDQGPRGQDNSDKNNQGDHDKSDKKDSGDSHSQDAPKNHE